MPRTYGSTAIVGAVYGQGTQTTHATTIAAPTQPVETYNTMTNTVRVVEPVTQDVQTIISAPVTYTDAGVVKAQHFKQGDLSTQEYNALLAEADRIRAYQNNNQEYSYGSAQTFNSLAPGVSESYEIELFAEPIAVEETVIYADTTPITDALQSANGLYGNTIGLGQVLTIPSATTVITENTYVAPLTMASTTSSRPVTLVRNVEPIPGQSNGVYAVLPKDTLYSISRMPAGHCLN